MIAPTLELEHMLLRGSARFVAGMDEVGRGALAGPVSVGVVVVDAATASVPTGLADSKLIRASLREALVPAIRSWCVDAAVGHASPQEIDDLGIIGALREAGRRALQSLLFAPDIVILDGSHDWLSDTDDLFSTPTEVPVPPVRMQVKADQSCAAVAAASVLAKVERDAVMVSLDAAVPGYGFAGHKGYGSESHRAAIRLLGASDAHRRSWKLL